VASSGSVVVSPPVDRFDPTLRFDSVIVHPPTIRAIGEGLAWIIGRRRRIRVSGNSMEPTLHDGEFVLIDPGRRRPEPGRLAVARHPSELDTTSGDRLLVIKRVGDWGDRGVWLTSDNPAAGTDSRTWGRLPAADIVGTVTVVLDRPTTSDLGPPVA
jgi:nickel-type superoxide dismutase maturation protease